MNTRDIGAFPAGRQMDELVARRVMRLDDAHIKCPHCGRFEREIAEYTLGETRPIRIRCDAINGHGYPCDWRFPGCPHYSTNIGAAWEAEQAIMQNAPLTEIYIFNLLIVVTGRKFAIGALSPDNLRLLHLPVTWSGNKIECHWMSTELLALAHASAEQRCRAALITVMT